MRLLIVTQTVDLDSPVLGFFHRWIEEFANRCEGVLVICLKEGRHELPANVKILSLGKEIRRSRLTYIWRFYHYIYAYRKQYDAVFVHMNPEYVLLGGLFWRQWGKKVALWRNHYQPSYIADIAALISQVVFSTSPKSYVMKYKKTVLMPIGIDTEKFVLPQAPPQPRTVLFFGRLDMSKRPDVFLEALAPLRDEGIDFKASLVGEATDPNSAFARELRARAAPLIEAGALTMRGAVSNREAPAIYGAHAIYCNLSPNGMFDKTIGEAAACGCILIANNEALRTVIPPELFVTQVNAQSVARALRHALSLSPAQSAGIAGANRAWVERCHSLASLIPRVLSAL